MPRGPATISTGTRINASVGRYREKLARLRAELRQSGDASFGLAKPTSNLFRRRVAPARPRIDLSRFNEVISVDPEGGVVECEAMTTYADLAAATLAKGVMPAVVPQLKSITLGGATVGVGIESSSFRYGLVHRTVCAIDVLLADGSVVTCTPDNEHSDLFHGLPNSYGTLGYALKITARVIPVKPYVELTHIGHETPATYFADLQRRCRGDADFIDGTVFGANELYITSGRFVDCTPYTSDYTFEHIYYRSIREKPRDYLTIADYIWRWDTDWFWCSKNLYAQNPLVRRLLGRRRLNSITYQRIMRWNDRWGVVRAMGKLGKTHAETVIQDIDIPLAHAAEFLDFLLREVGVLPIWICPIGGRAPAHDFPLYPLHPQTVYVNFGFWDTVRTRESLPTGYVNRQVERATRELGGIKSLYSDSYFTEDEFWEIYNGAAYASLKQRYDPRGRFRNLYEKCVQRL
jgi:FAD/FMN-containing dehydrogenase